MAVDWDVELLAPVMAVFGEGTPGAPSTWPTYTPEGGAAFQLPDAVFDAQYTRSEEIDGVAQSTTSPILGVRAIHFPQLPEQGGRVTIPSNGKTYRVSDVQPDGHGHILLILIEARA